jgi:hypothetical protein
MDEIDQVHDDVHKRQANGEAQPEGGSELSKLYLLLHGVETHEDEQDDQTKEHEKFEEASEEEARLGDG